MNHKFFILFTVILLLGIVGFNYMMGFSFILLAIPIMILFAGFFGWILPIFLKRVNPGIWLASGILILIGLIFPTSSLFADREPGPVSTLISTTLFLLLPLALINSAILLDSVFWKPLSDKANNGYILYSLVLSILLIVKTLHNLYEFTVWDNTDDGLGYLWLFVPIFAVLLSGLTLLIALPPRTKLAGILYLLLLPALMIQVSTLAQRVDFRSLTAQRAERVVQAIESFYASEGMYPQSLSELPPRFILSLPEPIIIYGQDWCYESGDDYYRLGYVDREHWSDPRLIGQIYKTEGQIPGESLICEAEVVAMQQANPGFPYSYWMESR